MASESILSAAAPAPIGPYSQAIAASGRFVFLSGSIPLNAKGELVGDDVAAQTEQVFANIDAILASAGASLADVVKTTVYLKDMNDFAAMNAVYAARFGDTRPARSTVEVSRLPRDVRVEIEAVAVLR